MYDLIAWIASLPDFVLALLVLGLIAVAVWLWRGEIPEELRHEDDWDGRW